MKPLSYDARAGLFIVSVHVLMWLAIWMLFNRNTIAQAMSRVAPHALIEFTATVPQLTLKGSLPPQINTRDLRLDQQVGAFEDTKEHAICYWLVMNEGASVSLSCIGK